MYGNQPCENLNGILTSTRCLADKLSHAIKERESRMKLSDGTEARVVQWLDFTQIEVPFDDETTEIVTIHELNENNHNISIHPSPNDIYTNDLQIDYIMVGPSEMDRSNCLSVFHKPFAYDDELGTQIAFGQIFEFQYKNDEIEIYEPDYIAISISEDGERFSDLIKVPIAKDPRIAEPLTENLSVQVIRSVDQKGNPRLNFIFYDGNEPIGRGVNAYSPIIFPVLKKKFETILRKITPFDNALTC